MTCSLPNHSCLLRPTLPYAYAPNSRMHQPIRCTVVALATEVMQLITDRSMQPKIHTASIWRYEVEGASLEQGITAVNADTSAATVFIGEQSRRQWKNKYDPYRAEGLFGTIHVLCYQSGL